MSFEINENETLQLVKLQISMDFSINFINLELFLWRLTCKIPTLVPCLPLPHPNILYYLDNTDGTIFLQKVQLFCELTISHVHSKSPWSRVISMESFEIGSSLKVFENVFLDVRNLRSIILEGKTLKERKKFVSACEATKFQQTPD